MDSGCTKVNVLSIQAFESTAYPQASEVINGEALV